jgi:Flp pilus assembly protein TadD
MTRKDPPAVRTARTSRPAIPAENPPPRIQPPLSSEPIGSRGSKGALLALYNSGVALQEKGEWDAAVRAFREAVGADPALVEGWNGLGSALMRQGKKVEAEAAFEKALSLDPGYFAAVMNIGLLRLEEGRADEAASLFSRAAALSPRNPAPRVNLAIAQGRLGRIAEAEETLLAARHAFPSSPEVLYQTGVFYERTENRGRAQEAYASFLSVSAGRRPDLERAVRGRLAEWDRGEEQESRPAPASR